MADIDDPSATAGWELNLPSLGADMDVGTIVEWYVELGSEVQRGDLVAVVSTEKADVDIEVWHPGVVAEFLVSVGDEIAVGTPIVRFAGVGEPVAESPAASPSTPPPTPATPAPRAPEPPEPVQPVQPVQPARPVRAGSAAWSGSNTASDGLRISPFARSIAEREGIDLHTVVGTGPGGAVLARDVTHAASGAAGAPPAPAADQPTAAPPSSRDDRSSAMRQVIAERMARANSEIPTYHLELDLDLTPMLEQLAAYNESRSVAERVLPAAVLLKATGTALAAVPTLNGTWVDGGFEPAGGVDIAVAISLRTGGLVTPTIADVDQKPVSTIMAELREMVTGARRGTMRSSWMRAAGATVTNLGDRGADRVHGIIFPPQVALIGFGRIVERPWVTDGAMAVRSVVTASLAADHRCTDGAIGSRFLTAIRDALDHADILDKMGQS